MRICVAGSIGSGKSTYIKELKRLLPVSYKFISVDELVRIAYEQPYVIRCVNEELAKLREPEDEFDSVDFVDIKTFKDASAYLRKAVAKGPVLDALERATSKQLFNYILHHIDQNKDLVLEFPTFFEHFAFKEDPDSVSALKPSVLGQLFHTVVSLDAPVSTRVQRCMARLAGGKPQTKPQQKESLSLFQFLMSRQLEPPERAQAEADLHAKGTWVYHLDTSVEKDEVLNHAGATVDRALMFRTLTEPDSPTTAYTAGSFDPITYGHIWVVKEAAEMFDRVMVLVAVNDAKTPMFTLGERVEMTRDALKSRLPDNLQVKVHVGVLEAGKLVTSAIKPWSKAVLVRGLRSSGDFEYERSLNLIQTTQSKYGDSAGFIPTDVKMIYLMTPRELIEVSSSTIKSLVGLEGTDKLIQRYVPPNVFDKLKEKRIGSLANKS